MTYVHEKIVTSVKEILVATTYAIAKYMIFLTVLLLDSIIFLVNRSMDSLIHVTAWPKIN